MAKLDKALGALREVILCNLSHSGCDWGKENNEIFDIVNETTEIRYNCSETRSRLRNPEDVDEETPEKGSDVHPVRINHSIIDHQHLCHIWSIAQEALKSWTMAPSTWKRRLDYLYFTFFIIHIPVMLSKQSTTDNIHWFLKSWISQASIQHQFGLNLQSQFETTTSQIIEIDSLSSHHYGSRASFSWNWSIIYPWAFGQLELFEEVCLQHQTAELTTGRWSDCFAPSFDLRNWDCCHYICINIRNAQLGGIHVSGSRTALCFVSPLPWSW